MNHQCTHCGKTFENLRLLNNHYNQHGIDDLEEKGFFDEYKKTMIKQKEDYDKMKQRECDSDLIFNERDNKKTKSTQE